MFFHVVFIHLLLVDGNLGYFHFRAIMNKAATNISVHVFCRLFQFLCVYSYEPRDYGKFIFKEIAKPLSSFFISSPIFVVACFSGLVMLVGGKSNLSCSLHFSKD